MRLRIVCVVGVLGGWAGPLQAGTPDARDVLQQAEIAIHALHAVRYEGRGEVDGPLVNQFPQMTGSVVQIPIPDTELPKVRVEGQVVPPRQVQPVRLAIANDGKTVTLLEYARKVFVRRELPGGAGLLSSANSLLIRELTATHPFEREAKAVSIEYVGLETVAGVECDVIHAVLGADGAAVRWHFGKADHLPRRVQRFMPMQGGQASITTVLSSLETKPEIKDDMFRLEKPADFGEVGPSGLLQTGTQAPDWTLKTADGNEVTLKGLRGKVVLLDFWATWCMPCRQAMPGVQKLWQKYKDKPVAVFGVDCMERDPKADPVATMKAGGFTYPLLVKGDEVANRYLVQGIPAFYVLDREGKVLLAQAGFSASGEQQIDQLIEQQLAGSKSESAPAAGGS